MWSLVADKKECKGDEVYGGILETLEDCGTETSKLVVGDKYVGTLGEDPKACWDNNSLDFS